MFIAYLAIFLLLLFIEAAYIVIAGKLRIVDKPHHQSSHKGLVVRGGGIIFYIGYIFWCIFTGHYYPHFFVGISILAAVSFVDDLFTVSPKIRLVCQFIAIILLLYQIGLLNSTNYHVVVILSIACVGAVNIYNFMDGINGMTGGYSLVVLLALLYMNINNRQFADTRLLVYVILATIVFLIFNFRRRAVCFAGDVGSLTIGFIVVFFVLKMALVYKSMSWIAFLSVYFIDGGMTILHRIFLKENLMKPHKKHAYQIMANELKIPHIVVSCIYMALQAISCVVFIAWPNYYTFFFELIILASLYLWFMNKYYHLHMKHYLI
jgi:UDP-N-acetylmuramyl pentapeptide phosphotransferase/UDP-N-acetylglucosamine-1-phosphate transferase